MGASRYPGTGTALFTELLGTPAILRWGVELPRVRWKPIAFPTCQITTSSLLGHCKAWILKDAKNPGVSLPRYGSFEGVCCAGALSVCVK